ncbi:hypothetical protein FOA52_010564 [Chlamydomonas sp. UWO 241]|nr:hypothetical protein FOA52_010564 [Chlamydomonas sp. UWO 241]
MVQKGCTRTHARTLDEHAQKHERLCLQRAFLSRHHVLARRRRGPEQRGRDHAARVAGEHGREGTPGQS